MSNGKLAVIWICATLLGLVGILAASFFISNRSATQVKTMPGGRVEALSDLQADAKTLLGLAQVLGLFGATLQISIPSPFRELESLFGFLSLDFLAVLNSVAQQNYASIDGHCNDIIESQYTM